MKLILMTASQLSFFFSLLFLAYIFIMNSEVDSSFASIIDFEADSLFASTLFQSTLKQSESQVSSMIWAHCHAAHDDDSNSKFKYYIHYTFSIYDTNISFNMWKHLLKHKIKVKVSVNQVQATIFQ